MSIANPAHRAARRARPRDLPGPGVAALGDRLATSGDRKAGRGVQGPRWPASCGSHATIPSSGATGAHRACDAERERTCSTGTSVLPEGVDI